MDTLDLSPIVDFSQSLKNYSDHYYHTSNTEEVSRNMVVSFDMKTLIATCSKNSLSYDPQLCKFDTLSKQLFSTVGKTWIHFNLMKYAIYMVVPFHGWQTTNNRTKIQCNRVGQSKGKRKYQGGSIPSNFSCVVSLKLLVKSSYVTCKSENLHTNIISTIQWNLFPQFFNMVVYALPEGLIG